MTNMKPTHVRHDSQMSMQISLADMELDAVFHGRKEDEPMMRW